MPDALMARQYAEKGLGEYPGGLIEERCARPPTTTRAHDRGNFIEAFDRQEGAFADWSKLATPNKQTIFLDDPYETGNPAVESLIADAA